jgi:hypothetical protein
MVELLMYAHPDQEIERRFHDMIIAEQVRASVELIDAFGVLKEKLRRTSDNRKMALLFVDSEQELLQILSLQDLLSQVYTILVLNNHHPRITALAHQLHPRFIGYTDWDTKILLSIILRMIQRLGKEEA